MCGIVGYIGNKTAQDVVFNGLKRLEYRGYDSAGIAIVQGNHIETKVIKKPGKLAELGKLKDQWGEPATMAIGHTRWATHGEVNEQNAHPHKVGSIILVHNGIIENYHELKNTLEKTGIKFQSATDTEIFAHLVNQEREKGNTLPVAVRKAFARIEGSSAFVVIDEKTPNTIVAIKQGPPLVAGFGKGEVLVASDVPAILEHTREVYYLEDNEMVVLDKTGIQLFDKRGEKKTFKTTHISWNIDIIDKRGFAHYMLKEIHEQAQASQDTLQNWLDREKKTLKIDTSHTAENILSLFQGVSGVHIVACGTAYYAGLYGQMLLEKIARIPARVELASEFRYREPVLQKNTVGILISQSGETADTLAALRLMRTQGMRVVAICNVRDSSITRESDGVFYTNAGMEICVASTKAFTTQLEVFAALAAALANKAAWYPAFLKIPRLFEEVLKLEPLCKTIAQEFAHKKGFLYLGRGLYYPIALEGALKLKEIAYVHAEGYPAGELKHGPIALVEPEMLIVAISPEGDGVVHAKTISNIEEVRARKGTILGIGSGADEHFKKLCTRYIEIPRVEVAELYPILSVIPLQLFAYYVAKFLGHEIDQPRNLAKSVTVE